LSEILPSCGWGPGPGNLSQNGQKHTLLVMSLTKKIKTIIFFYYRLEDLAHLLRLWTALQHNRLASYGVAKWRKNSDSCRISRYNIFVHQ